MSDSRPTESSTQPGPLRLRPTGLEWRALDGEVVALDVDEAVYLATNKTATRLWEALAAGTTHEELVRMLAEDNSLDQDRAERDVSAFLADLHERGLLDSGGG